MAKVEKYVSIAKCKEYTVKEDKGAFKKGQKVKLSPDTAAVFKKRGII